MNVQDYTNNVDNTNEFIRSGTMSFELNKNSSQHLGQFNPTQPAIHSGQLGQIELQTYGTGAQTVNSAGIVSLGQQ